MIEYKLLTGPELREVDPRKIAWPDDTFAIVAYRGEQVVGIATITNLPVVEGTWLDESVRGSTIGPRLFQRIEELYVSLGKTHALALSADPLISNYLERLGFTQMPLLLYQKELGEKKETT